MATVQLLDSAELKIDERPVVALVDRSMLSRRPGDELRLAQLIAEIAVACQPERLLSVLAFGAARLPDINSATYQLRPFIWPVESAPAEAFNCEPFYLRAKIREGVGDQPAYTLAAAIPDCVDYAAPGQAAQLIILTDDNCPESEFAAISSALARLFPGSSFQAAIFGELDELRLEAQFGGCFFSASYEEAAALALERPFLLDF